MKALVTGGTGFTGSYLVKSLSMKGYEVIVLSRNHKLPESFNIKGISLYEGDLKNKSSLSRRD